MAKIHMLRHSAFEDARLRPCGFAPQTAFGRAVARDLPSVTSVHERHRRDFSVAQDETIVSGVAGRYAQALFALAKQHRVVDKVAADLATFQRLVDSSPDLKMLVDSPVFSADDQVRALSAVLDKAGIRGIAANFLKLVAAKRRLFAVGAMIKGYLALSDRSKGIKRAEITVAEPLSDAHLAALKGALKEVVGGTDVDVAVKLDPSIIGGLIVKIGSRMVDNSLKTKLNSIRKRMKEVG
jgi:F-type H+-transporting ATPase subunit delta